MCTLYWQIAICFLSLLGSNSGDEIWFSYFRPACLPHGALKFSLPEWGEPPDSVPGKRRTTIVSKNRGIVHLVIGMLIHGEEREDPLTKTVYRNSPNSNFCMTILRGFPSWFLLGWINGSLNVFCFVIAISLYLQIRFLHSLKSESMVMPVDFLHCIMQNKTRFTF